MSDNNLTLRDEVLRHICNEESKVRQTRKDGSRTLLGHTQTEERVIKPEHKELLFYRLERHFGVRYTIFEYEDTKTCGQLLNYTLNHINLRPEAVFVPQQFEVPELISIEDLDLSNSRFKVSKPVGKNWGKYNMTPTELKWVAFRALAMSFDFLSEYLMEGDFSISDNLEIDMGLDEEDKQIFIANMEGICKETHGNEISIPVDQYGDMVTVDDVITAFRMYKEIQIR